MQNLIINIRIFTLHLQLSNKFKIKLIRNLYHLENDYPHGRWCVYKFFNLI